MFDQPPPSILIDIFTKLPAWYWLVLFPALVAIVWATYWYGPGSLKRRKKLRQELWLDSHAHQIQARGRHKRVKSMSSQGLDRDAFEREIRRWD